jgi:AraC-like DNA-binding protein
VLQALHQRPAQAWTLEQMAAFGRAFVRRVGMTPTAWMATPTGHGTLGPRGETLDQPD